MVQDLKFEIEAIKKTQTKENLCKQSETTDTSITNSIQNMKERISGLEDMTEEIFIGQ